MWKVLNISIPNLWQITKYARKVPKPLTILQKWIIISMMLNKLFYWHPFCCLLSFVLHIFLSLIIFAELGSAIFLPILLDKITTLVYNNNVIFLINICWNSSVGSCVSDRRRCRKKGAKHRVRNKKYFDSKSEKDDYISCSKAYCQ